MTLTARIEHWPLVAPFRITGYTWEALEVLPVTLEKGGQLGQGGCHCARLRTRGGPIFDRGAAHGETVVGFEQPCGLGGF